MDGGEEVLLIEGSSTGRVRSGWWRYVERLGGVLYLYWKAYVRAKLCCYVCYCYYYYLLTYYSSSLLFLHCDSATAGGVWWGGVCVVGGGW